MSARALAAKQNCHVGTLRRKLADAGFSLYKESLGGLGELRVQTRLLQQGRKVKLMPYESAFDLLVDGRIRIEVKTAQAQVTRKALFWKFNLHRHGALSEQCDFYVLRLEAVPYTNKAAIHLLLPAPQKKKTIFVSFRSLLNGVAQQALDFQDFVHGKNSR